MDHWSGHAINVTMSPSHSVCSCSSPQVVTYVNEGNTLNLICSSAITFNTLAVALFSPYSWRAPNGTTISTSSTASLSSINRVATGYYTCVTKLNTNANGVTTVNASTLW